MEEGNFSRYKILDELGTGGMAKVYRAHDPEFDREVALKILRDDMLDDTHVRERFEREIRIIAKLELEGIVPVYDMGRTMQDHLFFVMRLMTGGTLSQRMQNGPLSTDQIIHILQRIAPALDKAHDLGIVHRDLKPANILFDQEDHAFISDFGIAKSINAGATSPLTDGGVIMGTPRYMSPEQAWGETVDARSDIYSLGVIVFEMLIGKNKFDTITPRQLAYRESAYKLPSLLESNPDLPPGIQPIIEKVLARERDQRYNTATEFADALIAILSEPSPQILNTAPKKPQSIARLLMISGFIILALVIFAIWEYPKLVPPIPPQTQNISVKITPSITATPPTLTITQPPAASPTVSSFPTIEPSPTLSVPIIGGAINIAFVSNREVYMIDINGRNRKQLTNTNIPKFDLQWLPDSSELLYGEGKCIYKVNSDVDLPMPEKISCLTDDDFISFRVSPDKENIAISVKDRLLILPFDLELLATAKSADELQKSENICIDYSDVTVKEAQWSRDGKSLAVLYQGPVKSNLNLLGDTILILDVDLVHCDAVDPLVIDKFPEEHFIPDGYVVHPVIPSYHWDGDEHFVFNTYIRNDEYGDLYLYDISTGQEQRFNPVEGTCCYHGATFSPDGAYILFAFQDINKGSESRTKLYYIPLDGNQETMPFNLPLGFFTNPRENILFDLRAP